MTNRTAQTRVRSKARHLIGKLFGYRTRIKIRVYFISQPMHRLLTQQADNAQVEKRIRIDIIAPDFGVLENNSGDCELQVHALPGNNNNTPGIFATLKRHVCYANQAGLSVRRQAKVMY